MSFKINRPGVTHPRNASHYSYGRLHLSDFIDVYPMKSAAFGVDHVFYENGEVELRIAGKTLEDLL